MIKKIFRQMLLAQILSSMTVMICMLIDNVVIGRNLGIAAMTAYELASPVLLVFAAIGTTLSAGIQVQCGKTMGRSDKSGSNECFSTSIAMALFISCVGLLFVMLFTDPLVSFLGVGAKEQDPLVLELTKDYLRGFIIGAPAFILAQITVPYLQMSGNRMLLIIAVGSMTVSDIIFDILNVALVDGGMFGMGMASSLSYYVAFVIGLIALIKKSFVFKFKFRYIRKSVAGNLLRYGQPTVVSQICFVLLTYTINTILLNINADYGVAAYSVISTVGNICFSVGTGIGAVAMMLASICYSDQDRTSLKQLIKTMSFYSIVINAIVTVALIVLSWPLAKLFLADQKEHDIVAAVNMTTVGLRIFALCLIPSCLNAAFRHFYQGVNRRWLAHTISIMQNFVVTAIFAFILSRFYGTTGVWLSFVCGEVMTFVIFSIIVRVRSGKRLSAETYTMMKESFGVSGEHCFERSITNKDDMTQMVVEAKAFCEDQGQDEQTCEVIARSLEELVGNIIEYGFTADNKVHSIDVRLWFKNDKKMLRLRDNCVEFDPVRYSETHRFERSKAHAGIRTVMEHVSDARYVNALGLNNLTLEFK